MGIRRLLLLTAVCIMSVCSFAQNNLWTGVAVESAKSYTDANKSILPQNFSLFRLDKSEASQLQRSASTGEMTVSAIKAAIKFDVPLPEGSVLPASLFESAVLSDELQKANPGLKTYVLINPATNNTAARLTISASGISGIIFTEKGTVYINPLGITAYPDVHMVYYLKDVKSTNAVSCNIKDDLENLRPANALAGDCKLRTFRLAVAASGEYTMWAGSQANALTYITTTVNNLNAIYEKDATIHFTLVTDNSVIYPDSLTDPYVSSPSLTGAILTANQTALDANIGTGNYDLGIVFDTSWSGGLAQLSAVCNSSGKGRAGAGIQFGIGANPVPGAQGPIFDGVVAHEIAHLFSARHTHAATNGSCGGGNINAATAVEPGGGSTIMAYAGSCTGNFYQFNNDLYFHANSIEAIQAYATSGSAFCTTPANISNNAPVIAVPAGSYTIPASTPFMLTSTGSDADGNTLKYTWEQMDAGFTTSSPPQPTNTSGPNFRVYPPSVIASRTFPRIEDIIANNSPVFEVLSSVTRTMNFRVTVRDEAAGGGCTAEANVAVNVDATAGPFTVTSQNTATNWTADGSNTATITWNVANTTAAPVNCSAVDILFSTDGGFTYPYTLLSNTANDGTQTITVPNLVTYAGRIKVQSRNNIFFNINAADIVITSSCAAEGTTITPAADVSAPAGSATLDLTLNPQYGSIVAPSAQIVSGDPATTLAVNNLTVGNCINFSNSFRYKTYRFTVNVQGTYTISRTSSPGGLIINLYNNDFNPASPCANFITSNGLYNGTSVSIGANLSAVLTPGRYYTLAVGTFSATTPASLPASFTVSVSGPSGGNLYTGPANPGGGFSYTYVIVENATGVIKAIDASADLSNGTTYPAGTYTVYGLSYSTAISGATLNAYVGGPFSVLNNDLLNNPATLCGNLSKNALAATVNAVLPVRLLPLKVYKTGTKTALLKWGTASEQNNSYFEIQRSANGVSFSKILGRVNGKENSNTIIDYNFTDASPETSWNYYRVKQVDKDGKSAFSNVARVNFNEKYSSVVTYPNPVKSILNIDYYTENISRVKWVIIDGKGSIVQEDAFTSQPGRNLQQLNVAGLAAGTYLLRTITNNEVLVSKFVKE